ncbi:type VII secretion protein EccB [Streptomyces beijiangensis]|uniref:Type VII secretion protein EccB n=1 Tax=Streptomyces beijiangensis TaxID=163361 RepID=A0A939F6H4_9ACTN|nr:type VII secretion protein EccB [Streptomyces beijiangensis]MBO0511290.1 type VII secretion protein EccB [Streptomyces beijiangensis]
MATRKDELSAYSFARKRTVAAFLAPSPGGSEEGAPRPLKTVMPSLIVGVVLVVGCVGWGVIKPSAPKGWDTPGQYIIVDSDSTTRYVVLEDKGAGGKKVPTLHPVLNYASAKLLLDKGKGTVLEVKGSEIDKSGIAHGSTLGISYAPDRLPTAADAEKVKVWAVCERPSSGTTTNIDRAVFVLNEKDASAVTDPKKGALGPRDVLYVTDSKDAKTIGAQYIVDSNGTRFLIGDPKTIEGTPKGTAQEQLRAAVIGGSSIPQRVSTEWLNTLNDGGTIAFPTIPGTGTPTTAKGNLPAEAQTVGTVVKAKDAQGDQYYVVLQDQIAMISPFVAQLILAEHDVSGNGAAVAVPVSTGAVIAANGAAAQTFYANKGWPKSGLKWANTSEVTEGLKARNTSCSVYKGTVSAGKVAKPELTAWAGSAYPKNVVAESLNAYVSSGSGLLFKEISGTVAGGGAQYLLTDTGLRYALPANNDSTAENAATSTSPSTGEDASETDKARTRLGYEKVAATALVPATWAEFIPKGPTLDTGAASQPQGQ